MTPSPRDRRDLWSGAAVAGVIVVLLAIARATGWFGDGAPPETVRVTPPAMTP
jgi:hypothetical protein